MSGRESRAWAAAAALLLLFALLTAWVLAAGWPYSAADLAVSRGVQSARSPALDAVMRFVSLAGDDPVLSGVLVGAAFLALLARRGWREAAALLGVVLVGQVLKIAVKHAVGRPRPAPDLVEVLFEAHEVQSFPSGHTVHYVVFFGFLAFLAHHLIRRAAPRRVLEGACVAMVVLVAPSRIYLGAHWATDVLGGYLLGGAVLAAGVGVYRRWLRPVG